MDRRKFFGRSMAGGLALGGIAALDRPLAAQTAGTPHSDLPSRFTPSAYSVPSTKYSPFTVPDYYTYADDLLIERDASGGEGTRQRPLERGKAFVFRGAQRTLVGEARAFGLQIVGQVDLESHRPHEEENE